MKRAVGILSMALAPVFAAGIALAEDRPGMGSEHYPSGSSGASSGAYGSSATSAAAGFMGMHTMNGTITDIDADEGMLKVDAEGKELDLHFPKTALQSLKKGDRVTVQLAIKPAGTAGGTSGTSGMGAEGSGRYGTGTGTGTGAGSGTRGGAGTE